MISVKFRLEPANRQSRLLSTEPSQPSKVHRTEYKRDNKLITYSVAKTGNRSYTQELHHSCAATNVFC